MPATVLLKDIVDALEMRFDEQPSFLDLDTGQVETVSRELLATRVKHTVRRCGIEKESLRKIAVEWCEEHGIQWK